VRRRFILFAVVSVMAASPAAAAVPPAPLVLDTAFQAPLHRADQTGLLDRFLIKAFAAIGRRVRIQWLPGERALINADLGIEDGDAMRIAGLNRRYSAVASHLVEVPAKLCDMDFVAFARDPSVRVDGWGSLARYNIALVRGYKILETHTGPANRIEVDNAAQLFGLLKRGRADVGLIDEVTGLGTLRALRLTGIHVVGRPLLVMPGYLYLNQRYRALVAPLAAAISRLNTRAPLQAEIDRYYQAAGH
jgi:polar amino acid transport system substrate-binding protein